MNTSAHPRTSTKRLTQAEIAQFRNDGYVVGRGLHDEAAVAPVRAELAAWIDAKAEALHAAGKIADRHRGADFHTRFGLLMAQCGEIQDGFDVMFVRGPESYRFLHSPAVLDAVEDLIGPELSLNPISHYRAKPPLAQTSENLKGYFAVPWHQDSGVIVPESDASEIITCWTALVDVTAEMGCLQVLPGGHRRGHLPHINAAGYGTSIKPSAMPDGVPVKLEVKAGDVVFMHRHCPHHSGPNRSDRCRWSFDLRYHRTGDNSGRPWQPEEVVRSRHAVVRPDHTAWAKAWETCLAAGRGHGRHRIEE